MDMRNPLFVCFLCRIDRDLGEGDEMGLAGVIYLFTGFRFFYEAR